MAKQATELRYAVRFRVVFKYFGQLCFVLAAFHRGHLSQAVQEKLLADIDAQLLRLESGDTDEPNEQKPSPDRTDENNPTESLGAK